MPLVPGGGGGSETDPLALHKANNLSDVNDAMMSRFNLGAGTGDGDMLGANNLSDLASEVTARANLSLGTAATKDVGNSIYTVANGLLGIDVVNDYTAGPALGANMTDSGTGAESGGYWVTDGHVSYEDVSFTNRVLGFEFEMSAILGGVGAAGFAGHSWYIYTGAQRIEAYITSGTPPSVWIEYNPGGTSFLVSVGDQDIHNVLRVVMPVGSQTLFWYWNGVYQISTGLGNFVADSSRGPGYDCGRWSGGSDFQLEDVRFAQYYV